MPLQVILIHPFRSRLIRGTARLIRGTELEIDDEQNLKEKSATYTHFVTSKSVTKTVTINFVVLNQIMTKSKKMKDEIQEVHHDIIQVRKRHLFKKKFMFNYTT